MHLPAKPHGEGVPQPPLDIQSQIRLLVSLKSKLYQTGNFSPVFYHQCHHLDVIASAKSKKIIFNRIKASKKDSDGEEERPQPF